MRARAQVPFPLTLAAAALLTLLCACPGADADARANTNLQQRLAAVAAPRAGTQLPCAALAQQHPLVLLVLGQSNAGNHGTVPARTGTAVSVLTAAGTCHRVQDPLPGGTGDGASIWTQLPAALKEQGLSRPIVLALLAVDASSVAEWSAPQGAMLARLDATVRAMKAQGLPPAWVLWQQGEADARARTSAADYRRGVQALADRLEASGVRAPWLLARSTVCRSAPSPGVRQAVQALARADPRFLLGPDTDPLADPSQRSDGCHFNAEGLQAAARLWAQTLAPQLKK